MAKRVFATGMGGSWVPIAILGMLVSNAVAAMALYVSPDVPGAAPLVTKQLRYREVPSNGSENRLSAILYRTLSTYQAGRRATVTGYAINADYVLARYRTKTGKRKTRRIVVDQQTNTYAMKVRVVPGTLRVKVQGRRYDGAAGRTLTHKISPTFTTAVGRPFIQRENWTTFVPATWTTGGSLTMTDLSGGSFATVVGLSGGSLVKTGAGTLTLDVTNTLWTNVGVLDSGATMVQLGGGGATLVMTTDAIFSNATKIAGVGDVVVGGDEVFDGAFEIRDGAVWLSVDGEWQALDLGEAETVSFFPR